MPKIPGQPSFKTKWQTAVEKNTVVIDDKRYLTMAGLEVLTWLYTSRITRTTAHELMDWKSMTQDMISSLLKMGDAIDANARALHDKVMGEFEAELYGYEK